MNKWGANLVEDMDDGTGSKDERIFYCLGGENELSSQANPRPLGGWLWNKLAADYYMTPLTHPYFQKEQKSALAWAYANVQPERVTTVTISQITRSKKMVYV